MKTVEQVAREQCRLDLMRLGYSGEELTRNVEKFWPVLAAEIHKLGLRVDGSWSFSTEEIAALIEKYKALSRI